MGPSRLRSNNLFYSGRVEGGDGGSIICLSYAWNGRMEVKHNIIVSSVVVKTEIRLASSCTIIIIWIILSIIEQLKTLD